MVGGSLLSWVIPQVILYQVYSGDYLKGKLGL